MTHQSLKCHKAAILLGGHSSRMGGQPKFLLKDGKGQSYLKRQIKALEKADRIYLSAADAAQLALIQNVYKDKDCYGLIDVVKDCGPLGGLYTVLQQLKDEDEWIFVTACDVPELTESMVGSLIQMSADAYEQGYVWSIRTVVDESTLYVVCIARRFCRQFSKCCGIKIIK